MTTSERDPAADLALLDDLAAGSTLTEAEVEELVSRLDDSMRRRWDVTG
jgi:hypothetical protein